jgi:hypothetical protein
VSLSSTFSALRLKKTDAYPEKGHHPNECEAWRDRLVMPGFAPASMPAGRQLKQP